VIRAPSKAAEHLPAKGIWGVLASVPGVVDEQKAKPQGIKLNQAKKA
jgi:hypothetical protein